MSWCERKSSCFILRFSLSLFSPLWLRLLRAFSRLTKYVQNIKCTQMRTPEFAHAYGVANMLTVPTDNFAWIIWLVAIHSRETVLLLYCAATHFSLCALFSSWFAVRIRFAVSRCLVFPVFPLMWEFRISGGKLRTFCSSKKTCRHRGTLLLEFVARDLAYGIAKIASIFLSQHLNWNDQSHKRRKRER